MAMTLSDLQAQREEILRQMARPEETRFADRSVRYRTQQDLEGALRRTDSEIAKVQSPGATKFVVTINRGF